MDILELIKQERYQVKTLFAEMENTRNTQKLYECFNQLYEAISLHFTVTEETFYPALRRNCQDIDELINASQRELDQAKKMLEEIELLSPTSGEFKQKLRDLKQAIEQYNQKEETDVFPRVRRYMNKEQMQQIGDEFAGLKTKIESEIST